MSNPTCTGPIVAGGRVLYDLVAVFDSPRDLIDGLNYGYSDDPVVAENQRAEYLMTVVSHFNERRPKNPACVVSKEAAQSLSKDEWAKFVWVNPESETSLLHSLRLMRLLSWTRLVGR